MKTVKLSSREGNKLVSRAQTYEGKYLSDVYNRCSHMKQIAWENCWGEYLNTPGSQNFRICSHNDYGFTVAWWTPFGCRVITPKNDYFVDFDK